MGVFDTEDLAELRAFTDDNHDSGACTIRRYAGRVLDPDTLVDVVGEGTVIYTGGYQIKESAQAIDYAVGQGQLTLQMIDIYIDWDAPRIRRNDVITIDTAEHDWLVDRDLVVVDQRVQSQPRNRKLVCQMVEPNPDLDPTSG